jgi:parvulin-like peptidyl-prolyl isomerase
MKNSIVGIFLLFSASIFAQQTVTEQFNKITTMKEAQAFVDANSALKPTIFKVVMGKDSTLIDKRILRQKGGETFNVGYVTYKILEAKESVQYRASYIFLDGGSLTVAEIDSLKKIITKKISEGVPFEKLSDEYTMDGNNTKGDTGWFFGENMLPKEFQDAVSKHKKDEVFYVDVSEKQWHYIVKKTFDDDAKKEVTVLRANGR